MPSTQVPSVPEDTLKFVDLLIRELNIPEITNLKKLLNLTGSQPVYPHPHKSQAISSALTCLLGLVGTRILELRGSEDVADPSYKVSIDTDQVSMFNTAFIFGTFNGYPLGSPESMKIIPNVNEEPRTAMAARSMEIYETKDKRFFMIHGSVKPSACLKVIGLTPEGEMTEEEARKKIADRVKEFDAEELRRMYQQAGLVGDIVLKPEEFDATEHGRILSKLPLASLEPLPLTSGTQPPASPFPTVTSRKHFKPLEGIRVLELTRIIAGPVAGRILAELGAEVTRVIDSSLPDASVLGPEYNVNKRSVFINMKTSEGQKQMSHLLETADIFLQGYRPGVMGRLGLSHEALSEAAAKRGKPIVVIDESCYGGLAQGSPWADRPGYQQIADTLTGMAWENGLSVGHSSPIIPCFAISDHCGGQLCALMALLGLLRRTKEAGSVSSSVALCSVDLWIRNQEKYPADWVKETYAAGAQLNFDWGFVPLAMGVIEHVKKTAPGYFKPEFFETIETDRWGQPTSFHHMGPLIKFGSIQRGFSWTGPYGYDRVGWDDQDADVLAQTIRAG